jgi:hypothetical protein
MNTLRPQRNRINRQILTLSAVLAALLFGALTHRWLVRADNVVVLPSVIEANGSMGTCYSFYKLEDSQKPLSTEAYAAGSRWDRFDFRWNVIEPTKGQFSFGPHEELVDRNRNNGLEVVAILGSTAEWASGNCSSRLQQTRTDTLPQGHPPPPQSPDDDIWWRPCPPINLHLPWNHPENYWGRYVYQTVEHFKDKINVWEIWNEPDLQSFWASSPADYARLLQVGYQAVKAADPEATVLFGGLAYWADPNFYKQTLREIQTLEGAVENNSYFDVLSLHAYSNIYLLRPVVSEIQTEMMTTVGPHPIWLTETGVPIWGESQQPYPYSNSATAEEAAAYIIEAYAEARAAGVEKFFVFRTHDEAMGEAFGLIRNDRSLRPGYVAYQVAARYLQGENQITGPFSDGTVRRITFWGTPQGRIDVLWKETGGDAVQYPHPAIVPTATLIDHRGQSRALNPTESTYTVPLQPATANTGAGGATIIGGPPVLLIQSDPEPPSSALQPLSAAVYTTALTLTWKVTDTVSGYWYAQVEQAPTSNGPWTLIADWSDTRGVTHTIVRIPLHQQTYFRARARNNVGNWEPWPATAETWTTAYLTRTVSLSLTTYLDENSNNVWDPEETRPLTPPVLNWRSRGSTVISETFGVSWRITQTVRTGPHILEAQLPQYLYSQTPFFVAEQPLTQSFTMTVGLKPIGARSYLPVVTRNANP